MGWKSTICMTRAEMERAVEAELEGRGEPSDELLADLLELLRGGDEHGNNYKVVNGGDPALDSNPIRRD